MQQVNKARNIRIGPPFSKTHKNGGPFFVSSRFESFAQSGFPLSSRGRKRPRYIQPSTKNQNFKEENCMAFFTSAIDTLKILVIALGAGLGAWGVINLLEGYGNDNPGAKSQGMKQLMAGGGIALVGIVLIPLLSGLFPTV